MKVALTKKKSKVPLSRWLELKGALPTDQEIAIEAKTKSWTHLPFRKNGSKIKMLMVVAEMKVKIK